MNRRPIVIWNLICRYKYLIVTVVGVLIVGFIDDNSFRKRIDYELQISDLKDQIKRYNSQHEEDLKKLHDIQRDPKAIEKIARERYFIELWLKPSSIKDWNQQIGGPWGSFLLHANSDGTMYFGWDTYNRKLTSAILHHAGPGSPG